ncbi:MAG: hypothetical protein ACK41C_20330 [Phenylobacterium sp.]|uniref:hypothetical protein n=1 Tax=Phenylobacterium sp. TaxID=1871053 RepID=UPI00391BFA25
MFGYRLYFLNGAGHITSSDEFMASTDHAAIELAEERRANQSAELWQGKRRIIVFEGRAATGLTLFSE